MYNGAFCENSSRQSRWLFSQKNSFIVFWQSSKWEKVFKSGPSKICGKHLLKNWKGYGLLRQPCPFNFFKGCLLQKLVSPFLNTWSEIRLWKCTGSLLYTCIHYQIECRPRICVTFFRKWIVLCHTQIKRVFLEKNSNNKVMEKNRP